MALNTDQLENLYPELLETMLADGDQSLVL